MNINYIMPAILVFATLVATGILKDILSEYAYLFSRNNKPLPKPTIPELLNVTLPPIPPVPTETEVETQVGSKFETLDL